MPILRRFLYYVFQPFAVETRYTDRELTKFWGGYVEVFGILVAFVTPENTLVFSW